MRYETNREKCMMKFESMVYQVGMVNSNDTIHLNLLTFERKSLELINKYNKIGAYYFFNL